MHYHAEVWIPNDDDVEYEVERAMQRYDENLAVEYYKDEYSEGYTNPDGLWGWYQIGGRWTGVHDGYDPSEDPDKEPCVHCVGTGEGDDGDECPLCRGAGVRTVRPTGWERYAGDVIPVSKVPDDLKCHTLIVKGELFTENKWVWRNKEEYDGGLVDGNLKGKTVKQVLESMGITEGFLVTVDYHS